MKAFAYATILALASWTCTARQVCYPNGVGCFSNDPPWDHLPLPMNPTDIEPIHYLKIQNGKFVREVSSPTELNLEKLIIFTHGLAGSFNTSWRPVLQERLSEANPDHDLLFIDWGNGAALGKGRNIYFQPASNVRVVAQMFALWLKQAPNFDSTKVHGIGFSLGAHLLGVTAKRLGTKWGRISAIDPAAPGFMINDPVARIDKDDGLMVDVLHGSWVSLNRPLGHKDFYVNDARVQPGCLTRKRRSAEASQDLIGKILLARNDQQRIDDIWDIIDMFGCSHYRAIFLYAETIVRNDDCQFPACPCQSQEHFNKGYCRNCDSSVGQLLGFRSIESDNEGVFYAATTGKEPYCITK